MLNKSTIKTYPILAILSTGKKTFENLGRIIQKGGRFIASILQPSQNSYEAAYSICQSIFSTKSVLYLIIDDTLIKKIYAYCMQGAGMFYDTKLGRRINAFRLVTAILSDGRFAIPIGGNYLFAKELVDLCSEQFPSKESIAKAFIRRAKEIFPDKKIIVVADGLYATVKLIDWCVRNNISVEMRMHSNRVVRYKNTETKLSVLANKKGIKLTDRKMARTISVEWHGLPLEVTIVKRINKYGEESIVFQASTYKAEPREHVKSYKKRWATEMAYRTMKQSLGLEDCQSKSFNIQRNHVAAVLLSYACAQLEMKQLKLKTPEDAIRASKEKLAQRTFDLFGERFDHSEWYSA